MEEFCDVPKSKVFDDYEILWLYKYKLISFKLVHDKNIMNNTLSSK